MGCRHAVITKAIPVAYTMEVCHAPWYTARRSQRALQKKRELPRMPGEGGEERHYTNYADYLGSQGY